MTGTYKKCPYCGKKQFIPIQIISKNENLIIHEPFITCEACMDLFQLELSFRVKSIES